MELSTSKKQWLLFATVLIFLFMIDPVYAGPGGTVAKALFRTWWGKTILALLTIIFLPLIIYVKTIEFRKVKKVKALLNQISVKHKQFNWLQLEKEFNHIIKRVYNAWSNEDLSEAKNYMNHWYWQNQQAVHLEQWKKENLKNVSILREITKIRPLYLEITEEEDLEGSRIAVAIDVVAEDYLIDRDSKKVVQGKAGFDELDYVWFFEYTEGKWLLDDIREGIYSLDIAKVPNLLPKAFTNFA